MASTQSFSEIWKRTGTQRTLYLTERITNLALTLISGIILLRALGPAAFAVYGATVGLAQIAFTSARLSLDEWYANRFASGTLSPADELRIFGIRTVIGVLAGALLWDSTEVVHKQGVGTLAALLSIVILESLSLRETLLQAQGRFGQLSLLGTSRTFFGLIARLVALCTDGGSISAMLWIAALELVIMRGGTLILKIQWPTVDIRKTHKLSPREWANYALATLLGLVYSRLDLLLGSQLLLPIELGNYLAAQRFVDVYAFISTVIGSLMMPKIARLSGQDALNFALVKSRQMALLALAVCIFNILVIRPMLPVLVGIRYAGIDEYFLILTFGLLPLFAGLPLGRVALSQRLPTLMMQGGAVAISMSVVLFTLSSSGGSSGLVLAGSMVTGNSVGCLYVAFKIWRRANSTHQFS